jgi:hypothetical protein
MYTKNPFLIFCVAFFVCVFARVILAQDWESQSTDWAYECGAEAQKIYTKKKIQIPCKRIGELLNKGDITGVYIAIRDAALFGDKTCSKYIKKNLDRLKRTEGAKDAVAFYSYKNGDPSGLKLLADSYDKEAQKIGDHWTVELFGFMNDWEISGRRLVRHAKCCSDAVSGELLCSAIMWRRYVYGDKDFNHFWFKIGEEESVSSEDLRHFNYDCHP